MTGAPAAARPAFRVVGTNPVKLFGLDAATRMRRFADKAGLAEDAAASLAGSTILANLDYACDPAWMTYLRDSPGAVVTLGGRPALAHARTGKAASTIAAAMTGKGPLALPGDHVELRAEAAQGLTNAALRKREAPFVMRLTPDTAELAERASYDGAYKGVTDVLTLYLWRRLAFHLTRWAALGGLSPNMITGFGAVLCVVSFWLFWIGQYWPGIATGFLFMVLDTVDGKLARCTGTSSKWGNVFDHGIDLVHPPFWWWAWAHGLYTYGRPIDGATTAWTLGVIVGGYVLQRAIEGVFIRAFGMHIHVWQRVDSRFRLVTARRNPNMIILVAAMLFAAPDLGLIGIAAWTAFSLLFHAVRLAQAFASRRVVSWIG